MAGCVRRGTCANCQNVGWHEDVDDAGDAGRWWCFANGGAVDLSYSCNGWIEGPDVRDLTDDER